MTNRQCCAIYKDPHAKAYTSNPPKLRCKHRASHYLLGGMPINDDTLPSVAFVCGIHKNALVEWIKPTDLVHVASLLTIAELKEYVDVYRRFNEHAQGQIRRWQASKETRNNQWYDLVGMLTQIEKQEKDQAA